jgi:hypothetical protein
MVNNQPSILSFSVTSENEIALEDGKILNMNWKV